jgi:hypothetical protein
MSTDQTKKRFRDPRTPGDKCVNRHEGGILGVFCVGAIYEILKKKKVSWTTLDDCKKPVPKFEFAATRIGFLSGDKCRKRRVSVKKSCQSSQGCAERGNKRCIQRQIWEM